MCVPHTRIRTHAHAHVIETEVCSKEGRKEYVCSRTKDVRFSNDNDSVLNRGGGGGGDTFERKRKAKKRKSNNSQQQVEYNDDFLNYD